MRCTVSLETRNCAASERQLHVVPCAGRDRTVLRMSLATRSSANAASFPRCYGSEFSSQAMDLWAYQNSARIAFSRPGKPTDNAFVESFNGTFRAECLNAHWFTSLTEAQKIVETWRGEYNESRPHRALGEKTPNELAKEIAARRDFLELQPVENSLYGWTKKAGPIIVL